MGEDRYMWYVMESTVGERETYAWINMLSCTTELVIAPFFESIKACIGVQNPCGTSFVTIQILHP